MKKKWLALGTSIIALSLVLTGCGGGEKKADPQKTITMRLADNHPDGYPTVQGDLAFAKAVEEKSKGRIKIEVFTGGTLYKAEPDSIQALQLGDLAFARVSASPVGNFVPAINGIQMPYLYKSGAHM